MNRRHQPQPRGTDRRTGSDRREIKANNQRRVIIALAIIIMLELAYIGAQL